MKKQLLLDIKNLSISVREAFLLKRVSFQIFSGESVGLVGDSGSGKSVFSLFLTGLLSSRVFSVSADSALFHNNGSLFNLLSNRSSDWDSFRASSISLVFQDPTTSLNPTICCGFQVLEVFLKTNSKKQKTKNDVFSLFKEVGLSGFEKIFYSFPHQLSGGQKQRVVIAIALASSPKLLIADEPTTSLDPATQKSVLDLLLSLKKTRSLAIILISHSVDVIDYFCDRTYVFDGFVFHKNSSSKSKTYLDNRLFLLKKIKSRIFLKSGVLDFKKLYRREPLRSGFPIVSLKNISVSFKKAGGDFFAIKSVSASLSSSDLLGVIGGSGSGKTTLGRVFAGIETRFSGALEARSIVLKKDSQLVYQDPFSSFNPKYTVGNSVSEIIKLFNSNHSVSNLFKLVELNDSFINRFPHELSGGEKQRVSIARVLASNPRLIVFDESLSALDTETQYSILNLIRNINMVFNITVVFISHDIHSVLFLCKNILVLDNGKIVDNFRCENLFLKNRNSYTKKLISDSFFL